MSSIKNEEIYKSIYGNENLSSEDIMEVSNVVQLISIWTNGIPGGVVDYKTIKVINEAGRSVVRFIYTQSVNGLPKKYAITLFLIDDVKFNICDKSSIGYMTCHEIVDELRYDINKLTREDKIKILKSLNDLIDEFMNHTTHFDDEGFWDDYK